MKFVKVIYFDEGTAADYMQISSGGELKKTTEFITDVTQNGSVSAQAEMNVGNKGKGIPALFRALTGIGVQAGIEGDASIKGNKEKIAKTILENTLLADFIEMIDSDSRKRKEENKQHQAIKQFNHVELYPQINSFSYMMLMAPYFTMLEGNMPINAINGQQLKIDITKMEDAISRGRGYYEFIANVENTEKIFRFSSTAFRNNYTLSDIPKMKLALYAVLVGSIEKEKLDLSSEFHFGVFPKERINYPDEETEEDKCECLDVYDVIIAGISG